jgi:hypothetical protein
MKYADTAYERWLKMGRPILTVSESMLRRVAQHIREQQLVYER